MIRKAAFITCDRQTSSLCHETVLLDSLKMYGSPRQAAVSKGWLIHQHNKKRNQTWCPACWALDRIERRIDNHED